MSCTICRLKKFYKTKPSKESINALLSMYKENKAIKTLVATFDLDITKVEVESLAGCEISTQLNNKK